MSETQSNESNVTTTGAETQTATYNDVTAGGPSILWLWALMLVVLVSEFLLIGLWNFLGGDALKNLTTLALVSLVGVYVFLISFYLMRVKTEGRWFLYVLGPTIFLLLFLLAFLVPDMIFHHEWTTIGPEAPTL